MRFINIILIILSLSITKGIAAQKSFSKQWETINKDFEAPIVSIEMITEIYNDHNKTQLLSEKHSSMQRNKKQLYYKLDNMEMVMTNEVFFVINHDAKLIMIDKRKEDVVKDYEKNYKTFIKEINSAENNIDNDIKTEYITDYVIYTLNTKQGEFEQVKYFVNADRNRLSSIAYYYRKEQILGLAPQFSKPMLVVNFDIKPIINTDLFDINRFGTILKNKQFVLSASYLDYEVLNHLEQY
jgi:hypothetical protein